MQEGEQEQQLISDLSNWRQSNPHKLSKFLLFIIRCAAIAEGRRGAGRMGGSDKPGKNAYEEAKEAAPAGGMVWEEEAVQEKAL